MGTTVTHYNILGRLGGGGTGVVFKGHNTRLDRSAAFEFLSPDLRRGAEARERFIHEAMVASALQYPNISALRTFFRTSNSSDRLALYSCCLPVARNEEVI